MMSVPLEDVSALGSVWRPSAKDMVGLKGVNTPVKFGERTRDCSPGHAGKEGPQLARTGGFLSVSDSDPMVPAELGQGE